MQQFDSVRSYHKMNTNQEKQEFFLDLIRNKLLVVSKEGDVFNVKTERNIGHIRQDGYRGISYMDPKTRIIYKISLQRLVWIAFHGIIPSQLVINHIDSNKLNNNLNNLEAVTVKDNWNHAVNAGKILENILQISPRARSNLEAHLKFRKQKSIEIRAEYEKNHLKKGTLNSGNSQWGTYWITNGATNLKWKDSKGEIPYGYCRGRGPRINP